MIYTNENAIYYRFIISRRLIIKKRFQITIYNYYYTLKSDEKHFKY